MKPAVTAIVGSLGGLLAFLGMAGFLPGPCVAIGALVTLIASASLFGLAAFPTTSPFLRSAFGSIAALAAASVIGAAVYYVHRLDALGLGLTVTLLPWAAMPFIRTRDTAEHTEARRIDPASFVMFLCGAGANALAFRWLLAASTGEAIRTPWETVRPMFFFWIALATFAWLALSLRKRAARLCLFGWMLHAFVILSPAAAVYEVGYGFDPFVHVASERLVVAQGEVTPKTPYYIGQYALVSLAGRAGVPIDLADRWLLPLLAAVTLPLAAAWLLRRGYGLAAETAFPSLAVLFLLPLGGFISTTPQGLANLWFALTALFGAAWFRHAQPPFWLVTLLAAASMAAHPLAGIPAVALCGFLLLFRLRRSVGHAEKGAKALAFIAWFTIAALTLPVLLSWTSGRAPDGALAGIFKLSLSTVTDALPIELPGLPTRFRPFLDFAETFDRAQDALLLLFAAMGGFVLMRARGARRLVAASAVTALALLIAAVLLKTGVVFKDVIAYEQSAYGNRLYELALLTLLPLVMLGAGRFWRAALAASSGPRVFLVLLACGGVAAAAYAAFPRIDDFRAHRGYSTSAHDVAAVRFIEQDAAGVPYVALANQSVSAAALHVYGFKTYYGDQFFYPIPTGAPLYNYYLKMAYEAPTRETMEEAMRSVGVERAYFVLNRYWTGFDRIAAHAKTAADAWTAIDGGEALVFTFVRK